MEVHQVNVSKTVQALQLNFYNQMSITSRCQQKDGGQTHLLWDSKKYNHEKTTTEKTAWVTSAWCEFYAGQQWMPQQAQLQPEDQELHPDTSQTASMLEHSYKPRSQMPSRQGFFNRAGSWPRKNGCWNWHKVWEHWQLHATVTYSKVPDQIFSLILSTLASFSLFQAIWVSPATAALRIMKGFYRIKQRFRERREVVSVGGNKEKETRPHWASRRRENNSKFPLRSRQNADRKW